MMTAPAPPRNTVIGFYTMHGRLVCRDRACLELIRIRNDSIKCIVKHVAWNNRHCSFCQEPLD